MALDKDTVARIALLARVKVPQEEMEGLATQLSGILTWIEQLEEVDVTGVAPMTSAVETTLPQREDAVTDGGYPERVLANAPDRVLNFYTVPKVVE